MKLHVIIACHNRRDLTVKCVERLLLASSAVESMHIGLVLFDDGSTDGTAAAVQGLHNDVSVIKGPGTAYWAAGMAAAERAVLSRPNLDDSDYILWLNDDVKLDPDAFVRLATAMADVPLSIVVGAVRDPDTGAITYSGLRRGGAHPLNFRRVAPDAHKLLEIESLNGNLVAVPVVRARQLGGIDGLYSHALADIDYGLRAHRAQIPVLLAPGTFGTCPLNPPAPQQAIMTDWQRFVGTKGGGNLRSLVRFLKKSNPMTWPAFIASTYTLWWLRQFRSRIRLKGFPQS